MSTIRVVALAAVLTSCAGVEGPVEIDRFIEDQMARAKLPGLSAAVIRDGRVVWTGAYGWADVAARRPVGTETRFQLASVSKTITATVIMRQVERGRLDLDADVNVMLPFRVRSPSHPDAVITLRHLMTHTSGIRDNWDILEGTWVEGGDFPMSLAASLSAYLVDGGKYYVDDKNWYPWASETKSEYSNVGVALAAYLAEIAAGEPFESLCRRDVFEPLGLSGCSFRLADVDRSTLARPHEWGEEIGQWIGLEHHGYLDFPSGTLRMSAPELARFLLAYAGGGEVGGARLLRSETVEEMFRVQDEALDPDQGLVWYREVRDGEVLFGHDGGDPGVTTQMFFRRADGAGYLLLANGDFEARGVEREIAARLLHHALGE